MIKNFGIIVVIVFFALIIFLIISITNKHSTCFAEASGKVKQMSYILPVSNEGLCENGQKMILSLNSCLNDVNDGNILAPTLFRLSFLFPQMKNITKIIEKHNQVCPNNQVKQLL